MNQTSSPGVFAPATDATLQYIREQNRNGHATLSDLSNSRSVRYVQASYLLNWYLTEEGNAEATYRTFFSNSGLEAVSGVLKLARAARKQEQAPAVIICDASQELRTFLNPLGAEPGDALVPGVLYADTLEQARALVDTTEHCAVLIRPSVDQASSDIANLLEMARVRGALTIVDLAALDVGNETTAFSALNADAFTFGESLTKRQVPCGAFCAKSDAWERAAITHFSTFGGNDLTLGLAIDTLCETLTLPIAVARKLEEFSAPEVAREGRATWVYPSAVWAVDDAPISRARGPYIQLESDRPVLDLDGNSGCNIRGHCPPDVPDALAKWDANRDYWSELSNLLTDATSTDHAFPAVSGATANEIALTLALAAAAPRRRIVTFSGNFGGRTLGSCCLQAPVSPDHPSYGPLYNSVLEIAPRQEDALQQLEAVLDEGDVAAVWIQSLLYGPVKGTLSKDLLDCLQRRRESDGYLVVYDEIKTGLWRTGPLLASTEQFESPDIVTLAKHLSDMTFPVGVVLTKKSVVDSARRHAPAVVARSENYYKNQIGASVALHVLRWGLDTNLESQSREISAYLWSGLDALVAKYAGFDEALGLGLHVWTSISRPEQPELLAGLYERGVIVPQGAFNLPLNASRDDVDVYLRALAECLESATESGDTRSQT